MVLLSMLLGNNPFLEQESCQGITWRYYPFITATWANLSRHFYLQPGRIELQVSEFVRFLTIEEFLQ
jgi:hypothetical protein